MTPASLQKFMEELAAAARTPGKVYFTGGATALLLAPAIDPEQFRRKVEEFIRGYET